VAPLDAPVHDVNGERPGRIEVGEDRLEHDRERLDVTVVGGAGQYDLP
jgi:hypothetical protein